MCLVLKRASFVRLSDVRAVTDVSEILIYAQHLAYCWEIRQLQRVSMLTAAAVMVVGTTGDAQATTLYHLRYKELPQPYLIRVLPERERE